MQFSVARERLGKKLQRAKRQPFGNASLTVLSEKIGVPLTQGGDPEKFCKVTGEDGENIVKDQNGDWKSRIIISLEKLGMLLPNASHIALSLIKLQEPKGATSWQQALAVFGCQVQILCSRQAEVWQIEEEYPLVNVWRLDPNPDKEEKNWLEPLGTKQVIAYRPFSRLAPRDREGQIKTTDELADPVYPGSHFQRWGVLRMDVDNLGTLFRKGFGEQGSISRYASLSFSLRLFFEGWLPNLAHQFDDEPMGLQDLRQHIYIQYSGGDDLFIIGAGTHYPRWQDEFTSHFRPILHKTPPSAYLEVLHW